MMCISEQILTNTGWFLTGALCAGILISCIASLVKG